jgi:hypothetical protein
MKRLLILGGVIVLSAGLFLGPRAEPEVHLASEPPSGYEFVYSQGPRLDDGWFTRIEGSTYRPKSTPRQDIGVRVVTYPSAAFRHLMSWTEIPPNPNFPNDAFGIESPELKGIGLGDDVIWCGSDQPENCSAWGYWSHYKNQLLTVVIYVDTRVGTMTPDDFRNIVREIFP